MENNIKSVQDQTIVLQKLYFQVKKLCTWIRLHRNNWENFMNGSLHKSVNKVYALIKVYILLLILPYT